MKTLAFSPDGKWLVSGAADKTIRIHDLASFETRRTLAAHRNSVYGLAFLRRWPLAGLGRLRSHDPRVGVLEDRLIHGVTLCAGRSSR